MGQHLGSALLLSRLVWRDSLGSGSRRGEARNCHGPWHSFSSPPGYAAVALQHPSRGLLPNSCRCLAPIPAPSSPLPLPSASLHPSFHSPPEYTRLTFSAAAAGPALAPRPPSASSSAPHIRHRHHATSIFLTNCHAVSTPQSSTLALQRGLHSDTA